MATFARCTIEYISRWTTERPSSSFTRPPNNEYNTTWRRRQNARAKQWTRKKKEAGFDGARGRQKTALKARAVSRSRQTNHKVSRIFISAIFDTSSSSFSLSLFLRLVIKKKCIRYLHIFCIMLPISLLLVKTLAICVISNLHSKKEIRIYKVTIGCQN